MDLKILASNFSYACVKSIHHFAREISRIIFSAASKIVLSASYLLTTIPKLWAFSLKLAICFAREMLNITVAGLLSNGM